MQALEMCSQSSQQNEIMLLPCNKTVGNVVSWQNLPKTNNARTLTHVRWSPRTLEGHHKLSNFTHNSKISLAVLVLFRKGKYQRKTMTGILRNIIKSNKSYMNIISM